MPSIIVADAPTPTETLKKSKSKKSKSLDPTTESPKKSKKEKSSKSKKRKPTDEEETKSDTSSDKEALPVSKKLKAEKKEESDGDGSDVSVDEENPNALSKFRISAVLRAALNAKGIKALFPIQAMTFDMVLDGFDMVGRARTGQGKTLAFVLPILESLVNGAHKTTKPTGHGRPPSVLVLLPTRELASQVHADFQVYGGAVGLSSCCLYGGDGQSVRNQGYSLKQGFDIIVGTPGRIKDHIERGNLDLKSLKFRVLDEADEMLNMGFVEDVELILGKVQDVTKVQTLLFSATLPDWVKKLSMKFLKPDRKTVDLVGNDKLKASSDVRHLVLPCTRAARPHIIPDIIRCYSKGGRTMIFTETKDYASELTGLLPGSRALHGDVMQSQREVIIKGFREGKFLVLVATNVAARGLDISDVQLIIQCEPPGDVESYIHRSGRTGRAGNSGVAILLYEPKSSYKMSRIERESGVKFEHISAPQPADVAESAGSEAANAIANVSDSVIPVFRAQAEHMLNTSTLSAVDLLCKALAKAAGYTDIKKRSLLSSMENYVTLILQSGKSIYTPSYAFTIFKRFLPEEKIAGVKGMSLTADGMGAVFDVPVDDVDAFIQGQENAQGVTIEVLNSLPTLQEREQSKGFGGRSRFGGGGGGGFSGGNRGNGGRFSGGRGGGFRGRDNNRNGNRFNRRN